MTVRQGRSSTNPGRRWEKRGDSRRSEGDPREIQYQVREKVESVKRAKVWGGESGSRSPSALVLLTKD